MKRYDLEWIGTAYMQIQEMTESPDGDWVRWEDVEKTLKVMSDLLKFGREQPAGQVGYDVNWYFKAEREANEILGRT